MLKYQEYTYTIPIYRWPVTEQWRQVWPMTQSSAHKHYIYKGITRKPYKEIDKKGQ
jgi:hypothetical protein